MQKMGQNRKKRVVLRIQIKMTQFINDLSHGLKSFLWFHTLDSHFFKCVCIL